MRVMSANAFLLSILYLLVGTLVEGLRRVWPVGFVRRLSLSLDSLPARALELAGVMQPLRDAYFSGRVSEFSVRLVFGFTTVLIIFLLAVVVGLFMGSLRGALMRWTKQR
jgi:hypothetical protein